MARPPIQKDLPQEEPAERQTADARADGKRPAGWRLPRVPALVTALVIAVAAAVWIGSGYFEGAWNLSGSPSDMSAARAPAAPGPETPTRVRVRTVTASDYVAQIRASGQTAAARTVRVRAETDGRVVEIAAREGAFVAADEVVVRLDTAERLAQVEQARARIAQREIEYNAARQLADRGFQSETRRAEARADLETARAELETLLVDVERTEIAAPFAGILNDRPVEIGDFVQRGDRVATIVETDPILIVAQVPEQDIGSIEVGMEAHARLAAGPERDGRVIFRSAVADPETRTFRVEAEIANPDNRIGEGMTAELRVDLAPVRAHLVPPSIFQLDAEGRVGVMIVETDDTARLIRVEIVGSGDRGAYVTGLPETARVIMVGQQLVEDGETVTPVPVETGTAAAETGGGQTAPAGGRS